MNEHRYLDASPVATVVVRDGTVVYANPTALLLAGHPAEPVVGRPFTDFVVAEDRALVLERHASRLRGERRPSVYEIRLQVAGAQRAARVHAAAVGGELVLQILDITNEAWRGSRLTVLAQLGALVQKELHDDRVYRAVREGLRALDLHTALLVPEAGALRVAFIETDPDRVASMEAVYSQPIVGAEGPWTALIEEAWHQGAAFTDDYETEAARFLGVKKDRSFPRGRESRALGLRVEVGGEPAAILVIVGDWIRRDDQPAFRLFGAQISAALDAARSIQALSRRNAELAALNQLAAAAGMAHDLPTFLHAGGDLMLRALGGQDLAVYLADADRRHADLVYVGGRFYELGAGSGRIPLGEPFLEPLAGRGVAVRSTQDLPPAFRGVMERTGAATVAAVALRYHSTPIGALLVGWTEPRDEAACRLELLEAMGAHFAAAVYSHRLVADLRTRVSELTLLNEIARASASLDPVELLASQLRRVAETFRAHAAVAYLTEGEELVQMACVGVSEASARAIQRLRLGEPVAGLAAQRGAPVRIPGDAEESERLRRIRELEHIEHAVGIPLMAKGRPVGAFVLGRSNAEPFSDSDVSLLSAVGAQMGVAVENARLYGDLDRSYAELAHTQEQLVQRERLAALGELAAVVAHEVRNPLGVIFNSLGALKRMVRPEGDARMLFDIVGEEADRLNRMVGDLLDFARPSQPSIRPEPIGPILDEALAVALAQTGQKVTLERSIEEPQPPVPADALQMRRAFANVLINAMQAMVEGGKLIIRARQDGDVVLVEIADSGPGIPAALRQKVFEPFFTTRATGTGLGLAVVRRVLEDHRGEVVVEEAEGGGARFVFRLPLEPAPRQVEMQPLLG